MTIEYSVLKCKYISFAKSEDKLNRSRFLNEAEDVIVKDVLVDTFPKRCNIIIHSDSEIFDDINFVTDSTKDGMNNSQERTQDVKSDVLLGGGKMLDAFNSGSFVVIPGKQSANIIPLSHRQNHEIIDTLAVNGVMSSPSVMSDNSVGKLLLSISKCCEEFTISVLSPHLSVSVLDGTYPSHYNRPSYIIGKGEITALFYRYIAMLFFGYASIVDTTDIERGYDI